MEPHIRETVTASMRAACDRWPGHVALLGEDGSALSYSGLSQALDVWGEALRSAGLGVGDRVAVLLHNDPASVVLWWALIETCTAVPFGPDATRDQLRSTLPRLDLAAVITFPEPNPVADVAAELGVPVISMTPGSAGLDTPPTVIGTAREAAADPAARPGLEDIAMIISTSGTTGQAKLVIKLHRNLAETLRVNGHHFGAQPSDRTVLTVPLARQLGQNIVQRTHTIGATLICPRQPTLWPTLGLLAVYAPTFLCLPPSGLAAMLEELEANAVRETSLRFLRVSAAMTDPALIDRTTALLGIPVYNALGSSEATNIATDGPFAPLRSGSVGPVQCELRIVDESGLPLPDGEAGMIETRGNNVFPGYWDDPELNARVFTADGWYRTGDRGKVNDGYLYVMGREDDTINVGGEKIDPLQIEAVLGGHPAIRDVVAFRARGRAGAQVVGVAVVLEADATVSDRALRRWMLDRLPRQWAPNRVLRLDALPRNASGKVDRRVLADLAARPGAVSHG